MKRTPIYEELKKHSPKFVPFAGWEMPLQFADGVLHEHQAVRNHAGLFDVGHMGKIEISGSGAANFLQKLTVNDVASISELGAQYTAMCNEKGCPLDDMILYRLREDLFRLVVNASNFEKIYAHMHSRQPPEVSLRNLENEFALIALQGPKSLQVLKKLTNHDLNSIRYYRFDWVDFYGEKMLTARLGYTGEDGFEIMCPAEKAVRLWSDLFKEGKPDGIAACGLAVRDVLRLEAGFPLYGQELDENHNLYESKSGWIVKLEKGDFIGSEALKDQKLRPLNEELIAFILEKGIPRTGYKICDPETEKEIGIVTGGTMSPILKQGIGMGFVSSGFGKVGSKILIRERSRVFQAEIVRRPFLKKN